MDDLIQRCVDMLERECTPSKMSIAEAIDFWNGIIDEAQGHIEALQCDLKEADDDD